MAADDKPGQITCTQAMTTKLTKYSSFEEMKQDIKPTTLPVAEKQQLDMEAKQMAEILQALRAQRLAGNARK
jgi:hypothetical protein